MNRADLKQWCILATFLMISEILQVLHRTIPSVFPDHAPSITYSAWLALTKPPQPSTSTPD